MNITTLQAQLDFSHIRLLGLLDAIEKTGQDPARVLSFRPAPGRAHIGWQFMHCAATHDRYLNAVLKKSAVKDEGLVNNYAGGSTPSDTVVPTMSQIRAALETHFTSLRSYLAALSDADLEQKFTDRHGKERSIGEAITLLAWHEAHHQGQIHLSWNIYKAANGLK